MKLINVKSKTSLGFYIKKTTGIYPRFISGNEFNKSIKSSLELEISKDTNFIENQIKHIKEIDTKHNFLYASSIDYTRKINYKYPLGVKNISSTRVVLELPIIIIESISISSKGMLSN